MPRFAAVFASAPDEISPLSGWELIEGKVLRWVALGALGAANDEGRRWKDWSFFFNDTAPFTEVLVEHFPQPVVFVDAGHDVLTGASLAHTPPGSIVRTAYRDWLWGREQKTLADQRPSWDLVSRARGVPPPVDAPRFAGITGAADGVGGPRLSPAREREEGP